MEGAEPDVLAGLSHPVRAVSFEYLPHALNYTRACVDRLAALGPYCFNWSSGESYELTSDQWMSGDALADTLESAPAQRRSGDVYARLCTPEAGESGLSAETSAKAEGLRQPFSE